MTPLQQAAQQALEALESGALLCELTAASMLRVALEAEQAQAVEPVCTVINGHRGYDTSIIDKALPDGTQLFTHPAPPAAQQALSLDLLERLSKTLTKLGYSTPEGGMEHFGARIESQLYNLCSGVDDLLAQQVAVPVPMSDYEISKWWASENGLEDCDMCIHGDFAKVVRAVEAHHKIGAKP